MDPSAIARQLMSLVGTRYPNRILCGFAGGIVLDAMVRAAAATWPENAWLGALAAYGSLWTIALGVLVAVGSLLVSGQRLSEEMMRQLDLIERVSERAELSPVERRQVWRSVVQKAVDAFNPGGERPLDARRIAEEAVRETRE